MKSRMRYIPVLITISCVLTATLLFAVFSLKSVRGGEAAQEEMSLCGGVVNREFDYYFAAEQVVGEGNLHGRTLFQENCIVCHSYSSVTVGPALKGVEQRRGREWLIRFIKSPGAMIEAGDSAALAVYNDYNQMAMPAFEHFTDADIDSILAYIAAHDEVVVCY